MSHPNKKRLRRSMMFLNCQKPGLIKDPYIYRPDSIMLDLEDAVAENQKDAARYSLYHALQEIDYRGVERVVRINGLDTPHWKEAFGLRQVAAGGFGAVLMNGIKRGLFSNEAGSGSAPCAAAAADVSHPAKAGLMQAFGVFIDTILICTCSALLMLLAPSDKIAGLQGMDLLQSAMQYHLGEFGVIFIAVILFLFSFSTFIGILFYARSNVAYLFGDNWLSQTAYKILALVMLFIGGLAAYTFVWDLGDVGIGLMTIFNMIALIPLSGQAIDSLKDYERKEK